MSKNQMGLVHQSFFFFENRSMGGRSKGNSSPLLLCRKKTQLDPKRKNAKKGPYQRHRTITQHQQKTKCMGHARVARQVSLSTTSCSLKRITTTRITTCSIEWSCTWMRHSYFSASCNLAKLLKRRRKNKKIKKIRNKEKEIKSKESNIKIALTSYRLAIAYKK